VIMEWQRRLRLGWLLQEDRDIQGQCPTSKIVSLCSGGKAIMPVKAKLRDFIALADQY
jgi:hypothetical protein